MRIADNINELLIDAVKEGGTDLHISVGTQPRVRVHGELRSLNYQILTPASMSNLVNPLLDALAKTTLNSTGQYDMSYSIPKVARFRVNIFRQKGDLAGVFRVLNSEVPDYTSLGLPLSIFNLYRSRRGLILIVGVTGSGKSTSLYALIKEIKDDTVNIVTLEDPVEYKMDGVNQIQVNAEVGLTFASGLRSILRQDPDIVMVGEIRDNETANLAIQAALTGHLVFSTLHTNSAAGVLPRLLDMGIEPFLIASTVNTIIGQRLVRRVARRRDIYQSSPLETQAIREAVGGLLPQTREQVAQYAQDLGYESLPLATQASFALAKGKDTPQTPRGYAGRAGLYEVMDITEEIQNLIVKRATSAEIQRMAIQQGMITMRQDGYLKALNGITTIEEVNRVAADTA